MSMDNISNDIARLKKKKNAVVLAHTYQPGEVQDVADFVGDSYGLSVEASHTKADTIIFAGVRFMAETAAILSPRKKVIMPVEDAGCPMAEMITPQELIDYKEQYPGYLVLCYVNSTAEIKALADICCTSANAVTIARQIPADTGIIFVPDRHLGEWVREQTGHTMALWEGFCPTHVQIEPAMVATARRAHPGAPVLMHPEAPKECRVLADRILSTGGMCSFVKTDAAAAYILATEVGILHTLRAQNPGKTFYPVDGSVICPNMKKGSREAVYRALEGSGGVTVTVPPATAEKAAGALKKMLEMGR